MQAIALEDHFYLMLTTSMIINYCIIITFSIKIIGLPSATKHDTIRSDMGCCNERLGKYSKHIPPEQIDSCNLLVDLRSDLHGIGMKFFHTLIGDYWCEISNSNDDDRMKKLVQSSFFLKIKSLFILVSDINCGKDH